MLIGFTFVSCLISRGSFQLADLLILLCCKSQAGAYSFFPRASVEMRRGARQLPVDHNLGTAVTEGSQACIEQGDNDNKRILSQHHSDDLQTKCLAFGVLYCTEGQ